jgi:glycosyltransferase involved in cell wall biosynthesis
MVVQRWGYPTVVTLHELVELADLRALDAPGGPLAPLGARLLTALVTRADILCLTMRHYMDWLSTRRLDCAHIPIGAYHEPELLQEPEAPELLFFTTLAPFKGLELLLESFCRLREGHPNLRLTVAGTDHVRFPEYGRELKTRFRGMKGLHWLGEVAEEEVKELFCRAQIVLLPYTASTGSSSVLYQAATWGRAVVASDLPEIRELASEANLHVEFFRSGDVTALCSAIEKLLRSPEKRLQQTAQNFHAMRSTRPVETCRKYLQAFNRALEKRANPRRIEIPGLETRSA